MYNLLISGDPEAWEKGQYEIDMSRFLEYTNSEIVSKYKGSIEENVNTLLDMPCLFMYESSLNKDAFVGFIKTVKKRDKKIFIDFDLIGDPISPELILENTMLLDIRKWEANRTHWAIKDEDLIEIFQRLGSISKNEIDIVRNRRIIGSVVTKSKNYEPTMKTVKGYVGKVFDIINDDSDIIWFFRGHSDKQKYRLEPSISRKDKEGNYLYRENEHNMFREFLIQNPSSFEKDGSTIEKLVRMQHYSLPTRLLDITSNPLIALYFACISEKNIENDGEVICFSIKNTSIEYYDQLSVSIKANIALLSFDEKEDLSLSMKNQDDLNKNYAAKKLMQFIQQEKPYFDGPITEMDLSKIVCVKCKESNERIVSQSGAFLLFGLDSVLSEDGSDDINIIRITVQNKKSILNELDKLNINEKTIFPFIENTAKYLARKWRYSNQS